MDTNQQTSKEAIEQLELIKAVVNGNNNLLFSSGKLIVIGVILCLVPLFELGLNKFFLNYSNILQIVFHAIFYIIVSNLAVKIFVKNKSKQVVLPPLLKKAFNLHGVILYLVGFCDIALVISQNYNLIMPINMILFGLLFELFGRFSVIAVRIVAFSYLIIGILSIAFYTYLTPELWLYEIIYLGIGYIVTGILLKKFNHA